MSTPTDQDKRRKELNFEANTCLGAGVGVGALGALGAAAGAVCPLCVVFTPLLLGAGVVRKIQSHRVPAGDEGPSTENQENS